MILMMLRFLFRSPALSAGTASTRIFVLTLVNLVTVVLWKSSIKGNLPKTKRSLLSGVGLNLGNNLLVLNVNDVDETSLFVIWTLYWGFFDLVGE